MAEFVKKEVRAAKYKNGEYGLIEEISIKELLSELKPKHNQKIEIKISKI